MIIAFKSISRDNYRKAIGTAANSVDMEDKCADIYNSVWGSSFTSANIDTGAIWLSCAKNNIYSNPKFFVRFGYRVDFLNSGTTLRKVRNSADTAWENNAIDLYYNNIFNLIGIFYE